jgi:hypothetical protein
MSNHDVNCPIGYGPITFVGGGTSRSCPVSGKSYCLNCKIRRYNGDDNDHHVTKGEREDVKK